MTDIETVEAWDRDLSPDEVKRLSPFAKGVRTNTSITRKVETLEKWGRDGLPPGAADVVPWDRAKLRRWKDADLRLWPWADPQVDAFDGKHDSMMARFKRALEVIEVRRKDRGLNLKKDVEAKDKIIANLERQNAELLDQVRQLQLRAGVQPLARR